MTADRIRTTAATALQMRLHWGSKATTADLIALLRFLSLDDPRGCWEVSPGTAPRRDRERGMAAQGAGVTSGPGFGRMLDRLRALDLCDPYSANGRSYALPALDSLDFVERGAASAKARVIACPNPRAAAFYGVSGAETAFAFDPRSCAA